jgi:hypothetical protein
LKPAKISDALRLQKSADRVCAAPIGEEQARGAIIDKRAPPSENLESRFTRWALRREAIAG